MQVHNPKNSPLAPDPELTTSNISLKDTILPLSPPPPPPMPLFAFVLVGPGMGSKPVLVLVGGDEEDGEAAAERDKEWRESTQPDSVRRARRRA